MISWTAAPTLPVSGYAPGEWPGEAFSRLAILRLRAIYTCRRTAAAITGHSLPSALFAVLAAFQVVIVLPSVANAVRAATLPAVLSAASGLMTVAFSAFLAAVYLARGRASAGDHRVRAFLLAFNGTFLLLVTPAALAVLGVRSALAGPTQLLAATILMAAGLAWTLWAVTHLRRSFSLLPEARALVTDGPYRFVRHPVYLGELVTASGLLLSRPSPWLALACLTFAATQLARMSLEERLLRASLHGYGAWAETTRRLVPFLY